MKLKLSYGLLFVMVVLLTGCTDAANMRDEARYKPYEGESAFPLPDGVVARGTLKEDVHLYMGRVDNAFVKEYPFKITKQILDRGKERYDIFCSVCHDKTGYGQGMVVRRGFKPPRSLHVARLRKMRPGEIFSIATEGRGAMPGYAHQMSAEDRWAVVAYIRALQLSQNFRIDDIPVEEKKKLIEGPSETDSGKPKKSH